MISWRIESVEELFHGDYTTLILSEAFGRNCTL